MQLHFFYQLGLSQTSRKRPPKLLNLEELVVACENRTRGGLFREHVSHI